MPGDQNYNATAFPVYTPDMSVGDTAGPGLTKREYIATAIIAGLAANGNLARDQCGKIAVQWADALLLDLAKP